MELMKHNVLIDERYNMQMMANTKDMNDRDYLYIWDHDLQREHIFERLGSVPMDSQLSTWKNTMQAIDHTQHFQNKVQTTKKNMVPTLLPFMLGERYWASNSNLCSQSRAPNINRSRVRAIFFLKVYTLCWKCCGWTIDCIVFFHVDNCESIGTEPSLSKICSRCKSWSQIYK